ncbi:TPA: DotI/IcmL family type IV secretion protein [Yersinia enterocolitica]
MSSDNEFIKESVSKESIDNKNLKTNKVDENETEQKHAELASDISSDAPSASILREVNRLQLDNILLKRKIIRIWGATSILAAALTVTIGITIFWFPKFKYIPTIDNQAICSVEGSDAPIVSNETIISYAQEAVLHSYSYDYVNYRTKLNEVANKYYTDNGRRAFFNSLDKSKNLEKVKDGRLILRSMPVQVAQLEETGLTALNQKYWIVQVPISIEFYLGGEGKPRTKTEFTAAVTVLQIPASAINQKGIAIDSVSLEPYLPRN